MAELELLKKIRLEMARRLNAAMPDVQWNAYVVTGSPPWGYIEPGGLSDTPITYDAAMLRGADWLAFSVVAVIAEIDQQAAQETLDAMIDPDGPLSVKAALELERPAPVTLGGLVSNLAVRSCTGYRRYVTEGRGPALGAEWEVRVFA